MKPSLSLAALIASSFLLACGDDTVRSTLPTDSGDATTEGSVDAGSTDEPASSDVADRTASGFCEVSSATARAATRLEV